VFVSAALALMLIPISAKAQSTPMPMNMPMSMPMPSSSPSSAPAPTATPMSKPMGMPMNMPMSSSASTPASSQPSRVPVVPNPLRPGWPSPIEENPRFSYLLIDQLEYQNMGNASGTRWDALGWTGGDTTRLWFKSEGFAASDSPRDTDAEASLLYGKLVSPYYDALAGVRVVPGFGLKPGRTYAVIGLQGLAPYNFDVEPSLFISQSGKISARITGEFNVPLTQRLTLQPRLETNLAVQPDQAVDIGAGLNNIDLGLRLRYEIKREVAPYIGVSWMQNFGQTHVFMLRYGPDKAQFPVVAGVRLWF
jgi:copper resistance protein B